MMGKSDGKELSMTVELRPIPGYPGYSVSNFGRVWSGTLYTRTGHGWKTLTRLPSGYFIVNLYHNGVSKVRLVHQLVLEAFVGPRPEGTECRHLNGYRGDNRLTNLCWGTRLENQLDSVMHGTSHWFARGAAHRLAKLSENDVLAIRALSRLGATLKGLKARFSVTSGTIRAILTGASWSWLLPEGDGSW